MNRIRSWLRRLRQESRDVLEVVALPGLAAVLPWRVCYAIFKRAARWQALYRAEADRALQQMVVRHGVEDLAGWASMRRLTTLVDHADQYLALTRTDRWLRRHVQVDGAWPAKDKAALLCTFHWGAGMWALRHAAQASLRAQMMVAQPTREGFAGRSILYRYIVARIRSIDRILGRPSLDAAKGLRGALKALRANEQLMAVVDVPSDQFSASAPITLLGETAQVPRALFRLAVDQQIPVCVFVCGFELKSGQRTLRLRSLGIYDDVDDLIRDVFRELEFAIRSNTAAWHFWSEAERFFPAASARSVPPSDRAQPRV